MLLEIENIVTGELEEEIILSEPLTEYNSHWIFARRLEKAGEDQKVEAMKQNTHMIINTKE